MKKYPKYKDSGNQWIGKVPEHWCLYSLKYYLNLQKGRKPKEFVEEGDLPYVTMDYIRSRENKICLYPSSSEGLVPINDNDILVLWDGANAGEIVKAKKGFLSSTMAVLDFDKKIGLSQYLFYLLKQMEPIFKNFANGTTIPHFDSSVLLDYKYPLPPLSEQQAIADFLDAKTEKIDKTISLLESQKSDLQAYRSRLIDEIVWKENDNKNNIKYLVDLITIKSNSTTKVALENIEECTGRFIATNSRFAGNGVAFLKGDILYGKLRPYLRKVWMAEFDGAAVGDFYVYRVKSDILLAKHFQYILLSDTFTSLANGSTYGAKMPRVSSNFIGNIVIPLPILSEQQAIVNYLDRKTAKINEAIRKIEEQISDLRAYRTALISEAITGKIDVRL